MQTKTWVTAQESHMQSHSELSQGSGLTPEYSWINNRNTISRSWSLYHPSSSTISISKNNKQVSPQFSEQWENPPWGLLLTLFPGQRPKHPCVFRMPQHSLHFPILHFCGSGNDADAAWTIPTSFSEIKPQTQLEFLSLSHRGWPRKIYQQSISKTFILKTNILYGYFPPSKKKKIKKCLHNWEKQEVNPRTLLGLQANTNNSPHQKYVSTNNIHIPPGDKNTISMKGFGSQG